MTMTSTVKQNNPSSSLGETLRAYRELMKLLIVILLVFTTVTAMVVAAKGIPQLNLLVPTIFAGIFAAGGASAVNQYIDRDMDGKMQRTARRPIPSGRVEPINALIFGLALIVWSVLILGWFVNWLAAILALIGAVYYVVLYTLILKRNTVLNIVIGGGAGAMPVLVGWAAVTGTLSLEAWLLFAIVFYWTPPHSWALAILVNRDYAAAGVPMMPVARGEDTTRTQILLYSLQLVAITLIPGIALLFGSDMLGIFYLIAALLLGIGLIYMAWWLIREPTKAVARATYKYSSLYLALLFLAMIIDRILVNIF
ncbi:MAG: heme o synthase [Anaerolineae bacterium]|nr:heme o synthase [Anaerolineae bacterium]MDQ7036952.1 heme o synthase [Anaerolineae bacterium]